MNQNYVRGREAEYKLKHDLERAGYLVLRTAGSHGAFDLVALKPTRIRLIMVKRTADDTYKIPAHLKVELNHLRWKVPAKVLMEVWVWIDRKGFIRKYKIEGGLKRNGNKNQNRSN